MSRPNDDGLEMLGDIPDSLDADVSAAKAPPSARIPVDVGPTRQALFRRRLLALGGALAWVAIQVAALGLRTDMARLGQLYLVLHIGVPLALAALALAVALWPGRSGLGARVTAVAGVTAVSVGLFIVINVAVPQPFPFVDPYGLTFWQWAVDCFDVTFVLGAAPLLFVSLTLRRTFVTGALVRSAAVGLACGLSGAAMMNTHCENVENPHMLAAHGLPALVLTFLGAMFVRKVARA